MRLDDRRIWKRHTSQIRKIGENTPSEILFEKKNLEFEFWESQEEGNDIVPPVASPVVSVPDHQDEPGLTPAPPNEIVISEQKSEQQDRLRRSTRIRRPPERWQRLCSFSLHF